MFTKTLRVKHIHKMLADYAISCGQKKGIHIQNFTFEMIEGISFSSSYHTVDLYGTTAKGVLRVRELVFELNPLNVSSSSHLIIWYKGLMVNSSIVHPNDRIPWVLDYAYENSGSNTGSHYLKLGNQIERFLLDYLKFEHKENTILFKEKFHLKRKKWEEKKRNTEQLLLH